MCRLEKDARAYHADEPFWLVVLKVDTVVRLDLLVDIVDDRLATGVVRGFLSHLAPGSPPRSELQKRILSDTRSWTSIARSYTTSPSRWRMLRAIEQWYICKE